MLIRKVFKEPGEEMCVKGSRKIRGIQRNHIVVLLDYHSIIHYSAVSLCQHADVHAGFIICDYT